MLPKDKAEKHNFGEIFPYGSPECEPIMMHLVNNGEIEESSTQKARHQNPTWILRAFGTYSTIN